ncbi:Skeletor-like 1 [Homarus americanus]|uniref:Skeletor-like 1 n=1 Tax=Homarus americanus TaxID=6706 RepID=A0A8J5KK66_HOMAM|nr:Skeletor-like 1 [Homarus americanus]
MGSLVPLQHQVKGEIYAVDSRTIHIRGFSYDGSAPDAFFYGGTSGRPSDRGFIIPDENGGTDPLGRYSNQDVTLTLPEGKTLKDLKWLSVWCRAFAIDFGHVMVNSNLNYPRPQKIDALPSLEHGVSSDRIVVVDAQTFLIPNFSYDGTAPDGHFWVGKGSTPGPSGQVVPDENGSEEPLKLYSGKTIVITLPGDLTVFDIDFLGVWCRAFLADFGHVRIPRNLNVPPSLKMLGVAPQSSGYSYKPPTGRPSFSHKPQTTYQKPTTYRPKYSPPTRPPTTRRPSYRTATNEPVTRPPYSPPPSPYTTRRPSPYSSPVTTPRPYYPRPITRSPVKPTTTSRPYYIPPPTTRRPVKAPTTPRPFYKPPTTTRRPYEHPPTTRRPYAPPTTTRRPFYRHPHFKTASLFPGAPAPSQRQLTDDLESSSRGYSGGGHPSAERESYENDSSEEVNIGSRFPPPLSSAAASHFGAPSHAFGQSANRPKGPSASSVSAVGHRFGSGAAVSTSSSERRPPAVSSFSFKNGGSSTSFNIYG